MRVVLDTNVLIAAFLTEGTSKDVLDRALSEKSCILSPYILDEFRRVLISKKFDFPRVLIDQFAGFLEKHARLVKEDAALAVRSPDPDDQRILQLCLTAKADLLVTGDEELLRLSKIGPTRIVSPGDFWGASFSLTFQKRKRYT